ncbi:uncharacterized protein LOC128190065 [Crassostrea angulata]|uniref:uncharacterized protein LOC128190065 n=1 Tax=Magallana angulata TaxID=2784310 RepID=UPI0022B0B6D2|nr:uncharacterized protein LOC128190065 [Crassostrea angulata]
MERYLTFFVVITCFVHNSEGSLINSPCKKSSDWSNHYIRCPTDHTIYIAKHVIEDGFNTLMSPALGCFASDAVYCGVELPTNNTNIKNYHIMDSAVNACNGRNECTLSRQYFLEAEAALKKFCNASLRPEVQKATFRQSIDYECIQDSQIINMSVVKNESRPFGPVYLKASSANCSCDISGAMSSIEILQAKSVFLLIQSKENTLLEHPDTSVGLYGVRIPLKTEDIVITILNGTNTSLALMKVRSEGILRIRCSNYKILRRAREFRVQKMIESRLFQSSRSYGALESTTSQQNDQQVGTVRPDVRFTIGGSLKPNFTFTIGDVLNLTLSFFIIFLFVLSILYKRRTNGHVSAEIKLKDKEEKLVLVCYPNNGQKKAKVEIHQADCMCVSTTGRPVRRSNYTSLQIVNPSESSDQRNKNSADLYSDVV